MKRSGKLLFGVLGMILLVACSHASDVHWVSADKITVEWDATTTHMNGSPITKNEGKVMYLLYIREKDTDKKMPVEKYVDEDEVVVPATEPIPQTKCKIKFEDDSRFKDGHRYHLGVKAGIYKFGKDEKIIGKPVFSEISWSCNETCTSDHPFGVIIKK